MCHNPHSSPNPHQLEAKGLHPYRLHVAIDYLPGCAECFGYRCPRACKGDGYNRALQADLAKSVWSAIGASWYKLADGTITNNWPHSTIRYQRLLRRVRLEDYDT